VRQVRIRNFNFNAFFDEVSPFVELFLGHLDRHYFIQNCPHVPLAHIYLIIQAELWLSLTLLTRQPVVSILK
jgi:hypothetical protein